MAQGEKKDRNEEQEEVQKERGERRMKGETGRGERGGGRGGYMPARHREPEMEKKRTLHTHTFLLRNTHM